MYIEVSTRGVDNVLKLWLVGPYGRQEPDVEAEYVTARQAADVSGLPITAVYNAIHRRQLNARRGPTGRWLIDSESLRTWAKERSPRFRRRYLWIHPVTERQRRLEAQFLQVLEQAKARAAKTNVQFEENWISTLIAQIHERERRAREDGLYLEQRKK